MSIVAILNVYIITYQGCLNTKIVGVRFYSGYASAGERVTLQREPYNQYDQNAIKVLSVMGAQIGHIPRIVASHLAKYMVNQTNEVN